MGKLAITIKTVERPGVLSQITDLIAQKGINITYTHLYVEEDGSGSIYLELEDWENIEELLEQIKNAEPVKQVIVHRSLDEIYGKRIIIIGGGAQVAQVAMGAISEADRHNIRGERISIDTIPLVGEMELAEAVSAVGRLPRVGALVLAGSLMGGKISEAVENVKKEHQVVVISLSMPGSVIEKADLVVTDPIQAGVMAVMAVADTAIFDIKKVRGKKF
jgi:energy-converting hydrogenase B subunit Q